MCIAGSGRAHAATRHSLSATAPRRSMNRRRILRQFLAVLSFAGLAFTALGTLRAETLTIERLYQSPELSGESLRAPRFSPDGRLIAYLKSSAADRSRFDLWAFDVAERRHRKL